MESACRCFSIFVLALLTTARLTDQSQPTRPKFEQSRLGPMAFHQRRCGA
jgi:hypothetical protein